jgi:hypothetical protein
MYKTRKTNEKGVFDTMKRTDAILVLRNVNADMTSQGGFKYPKRGWVEASDWKDTDECGNGLHGLPWGVGGSGYLYYGNNTVWLIIKVNPADGYQHGTGDMTDKCKFRRGYVVYCGCRDDAVQYLLDHGAADKPVVYCKKTGGDESTLTGGDESTLTGGNWSTLTGGNWSTLTGGNESTLIFRYYDCTRYRFVVGYVGENGIKPNVAYKLDENHVIVVAEG